MIRGLIQKIKNAAMAASIPPTDEALFVREAGFTVVHRNTPREKSGDYLYDVYRQGQKVGEIIHDFRGDAHSVRTTGGWKECEGGILNGGGGTPLSLNAWGEEIFVRLLEMPAGWRAKERLAAFRKATAASEAYTRLRAAAALHRLGKIPDLEPILSLELRRVTILDGACYALSLISDSPSPAIQRILLEEVRNRPEVAFSFAAKLCGLSPASGYSENPRILGLLRRLGPRASEPERAAAYGELCELLEKQRGGR